MPAAALRSGHSGGGCFIARDSSPTATATEACAVAARWLRLSATVEPRRPRPAQRRPTTSSTATSPTVSETVQQVIGGKVQWQPSERVDLQLDRRPQHRCVRQLPETPTATRRGLFRAPTATARHCRATSAVGKEQLLTVGLDWLHDRVESDTDYSEYRARQQGRVRAVPGQVRRAVARGQRAPRRQRAVRQPHHRRRGVGLATSRGTGASLPATAPRSRRRPSTTCTSRSAFPATRTCARKSRRRWEAGLAYRGNRFNWRLDTYSTESMT